MSENLLQLQEGSKSFGSKTLFEKASFAVNKGEHIGVIGPNGAGKSTLFQILLGKENLDSGSVITSKKLSIGYLSQHDSWEREITGNQYLDSVCTLPIWEVKSRGRVLQLNEEILDRPILSLSGGYRMRIKLLGLLGQDPNLMLLDEPTNYLDLETTLVLENFLQGFDGAFLLISHDREFLRLTTDHILEIESGEMTKFPGNIDDYFSHKDLMRNQLQARAMGQAEKRKAVLDFVARFGASATKARQAQSRLKSLQRMELIEIKPLPTTVNLSIPPPIKTGKNCISVFDAEFGYGEKSVLKNVSLQILRGDHVAVVGLNGAGKSTLLRGISGSMPPMKGRLEKGMGVEIGFFAQHVVESLSPEDTVYGSLEKAAHKQVMPQEILDLAGSLLFSGDSVHKSIAFLSGGEKSRVALGRVLLQKAPCLILDEPTNHLDFQTVEALTKALNSYEGTVLVVSHDRGFIKRTATKILEVSSGRVSLYPGTYEEYVWSLQSAISFSEPNNSSSRTAPIPLAKAESVSTDGPKNWKEEKKRLQREQRVLEKKILENEKETQRISKEIDTANSQMSEGKANLESIRLMAENVEKLQQLEEEWLVSMEEKDRLEKRISEMT